jgi:hypothetical protein
VAVGVGLWDNSLQSYSTLRNPDSYFFEFEADLLA